MSNPEDLVVEHIEIDVEEVKEQEYNRGIFCRAIRFKGGEEIVTGVHVDDMDWTVKKFVTIHQPMVIDASSGKMVPWSSVGNQYAYEISTDMIRSMYEVRVRTIDQWSDASAEQHYAFLREDLLDPTLPDEEREAIEQELADAEDGSQEPDFEVPEMFGYLAVTKTLQ
jgi:hypothetical protein